MEKKTGRPINIALVLVMIVAIGLLIVTHVDPAQTLIGMLLGVFVLVVILDGGRQKALSAKLGPEIQQEIDAGLAHDADLPANVIALMQGGKKIEAIKSLNESTRIGFLEAKNRLDVIHLRLSMGQTVRSGSDRNSI